MRKAILTPLVITVLIMLIGADIRRPVPDTKPEKKFCNGYTIVEFGKAVDCNGDTINLVKVNGGQELLRNRKEPV
jgi:hypothetical protein